MSKPGHNSGDVDASQLRAYVERAVRLKEEIASLNSDVADLYGEAASAGFDKAALKEVVKVAMAPADKREKLRQTDDALSVYLVAMGLAQ